MAKEKESWLDAGMWEELETINLANIELSFEIDDVVGPYENILGSPNDDEKKLFVLAAMYTITGEEAEARKDYGKQIVTQLRAKVLLNRFYYLLAERFNAEERCYKEMGVRIGWQVVGLTIEECEKRDKTEEFFSKEGDENLQET